MKKTVILVVAAMLVVASLVGGVFAMYKTDLDDVNGGDLVAKTFILNGSTTEAFGTGVKIAPGESKTSKFVITNKNDAGAFSETDIDVTIELTFTSEITPLTIKIVDGDGNVVISEMTAGAKTSSATRFAANVESSKTYTVTVTWPAGTAGSDNAFIGKTAGYTVSVHGVQAL